MDTKKWVRWQDWVALVVGAVVLLTPLWSDPVDAFPRWSMVILGALLAVSALWSLAVPSALSTEWIHAGLGVLMFVAPWAASFTDTTTAAWTSWIAGVIAAVLGVETVFQLRAGRAHSTA